MNENKNSPKDLMAFFSNGARKVTVAEMNEFWKDMPEEERDYYRHADLS